MRENVTNACVHAFIHAYKHTHGHVTNTLTHIQTCIHIQTCTHAHTHNNIVLNWYGTKLRTFMFAMSHYIMFSASLFPTSSFSPSFALSSPQTLDLSSIKWQHFHKTLKLIWFFRYPCKAKFLDWSFEYIINMIIYTRLYKNKSEIKRNNKRNNKISAKAKALIIQFKDARL